MNDIAARPVSLADVEPFRLSAGHAERRADVEAKQAQLSDLLKETGREGLLLLEPANFAWLTAGAAPAGILDPDSFPVLYCTAAQRWLIAANVDSQRCFDEELDGLGFQLKEWPWHWNRTQYLADLSQGKALACDRPFADGKVVGEPLARWRRTLSPYEQTGLRALGQIVGHAVEATCRTLTVGQTEQEIAGQLSHRLYHRGAVPTAIGVAADGRSRLYRRGGGTDTPVRRSCVITATATKFGLFATAGRMVCFGHPDAALLREANAACKVAAAYVAASRPRAVPRDLFDMARRVYLVSGFEHEWRLGPQGHLTGRLPVEMSLTPSTLEMLQPGCAVTWAPTVGEASSCDTFLVTDQGAELMTSTEFWPAKSIRVQGTDVARPFVLMR
jgi:Xaa-Pro aminopeptidase